VKHAAGWPVEFRAVDAGFALMYATVRTSSPSSTRPSMLDRRSGSSTTAT
jgi:hypothetical protein